jgi:hypothetical protein
MDQIRQMVIRGYTPALAWASSFAGLIPYDDVAPSPDLLARRLLMDYVSLDGRLAAGAFRVIGKATVSFCSLVSGALSSPRERMAVLFVQSVRWFSRRFASYYAASGR